VLSFKTCAVPQEKIYLLLLEWRLGGTHSQSGCSGELNAVLSLLGFEVTALTTLWLGIQCTKYCICGKRGQCFIQKITLQMIHIWEWPIMGSFNIHLTQMCVGMPVCLLAKLIDLNSKHNPFTPFYSNLTATGWKLVC